MSTIYNINIYIYIVGYIYIIYYVCIYIYLFIYIILNPPAQVPGTWAEVFRQSLEPLFPFGEGFTPPLYPALENPPLVPGSLGKDSSWGGSGGRPMRVQGVSCLILSYLSLSYLILSYLIFSYLVLAYLILACLVLAYLLLWHIRSNVCVNVY